MRVIFTAHACITHSWGARRGLQLYSAQPHPKAFYTCECGRGGEGLVSTACACGSIMQILHNPLMYGYSSYTCILKQYYTNLKSPCYRVASQYAHLRTMFPACNKSTSYSKTSSWRSGTSCMTVTTSSPGFQLKSVCFPTKSSCYEKRQPLFKCPSS